eukprot:CAMPEP_0196585934 /NCGR_PEP_ID=MMETSP1081-20130531/52585_1 /TAXON_ID=36882 /ORGANISM="Pyramimonas amylifera, Strain CCMP720" /LENGTH=56 /DNA_ID=CAMNT_0041907645 /DNA_START=437 /DNA_END=607 /DNA_ORIENTATION=+
MAHVEETRLDGLQSLQEKLNSFKEELKSAGNTKQNDLKINRSSVLAKMWDGRIGDD